MTFVTSRQYSAFKLLPVLTQHIRPSPLPNKLSLLSAQNALIEELAEAHSQLQLLHHIYVSLQAAESDPSFHLKKRNRRKANQIQNRYQCNYQNCNKSYSSAASLTMHRRTKHSNTEREPPPIPKYELPPQPNLNENSTEPISFERSFQKYRSEYQDESEQPQFSVESDLYTATCSSSKIQ